MDRPDNPSPAPGISPVKAFAFVLLLIVLATTGFLMASGSEPSPTSPDLSAPPATPDFSLTDQEAIARFEELYLASIDIYKTLDSSLIPYVYLEGSAPYRRVQREIRRLQNRGVKAITEAETKSVQVISNTPDQIMVRHVVVVDVAFVDGQGRDVTEGGGQEQQIIEWQLRPSRSYWLIAEGTILEARSVQ